jgi:hypothetical protein
VPTYGPDSQMGEVLVGIPYVASYTPSGGSGALLTLDMLVTGDVQFENPGNMIDGQRFILRLRSDGSSHTVSFGTAYRGSSDTPLSSFTLPASSTEYRAFKWNAPAGKADFLSFDRGFV